MVNAQGGHDLGSAAGADLGGILAVADVADPVQGLDAPVAADPSGKLGRAGLAGGQAGHGVDGCCAPLFPAAQRPDPAGEADGLGGVRKADPGGDGDGLQGAAFLAAVAPVVLAVPGRDVPPRQVPELGVQAGLVAPSRPGCSALSSG
jgi:hypothetical protein